jgi:hypothetical protein
VWAVAILLIPLLGVMAWKSHREARLPPLPVNVKYRHALLGQGYVLVLRNTSGQSLQLMASLTHPSINDTRRFDVYIAVGRPHYPYKLELPAVERFNSVKEGKAYEENCPRTDFRPAGRFRCH